MDQPVAGFDADAHAAEIRQRGYTVIRNFMDADAIARFRQGLAPFVGRRRGRNDFEGFKTERVYTLGVTPQFERRQLFAIWKPILIELEKRTGLRFDLAIMPDIPSFERQYNAGAFDFAYMNPYLMVANPAGYIPLVRDETPVTGILVVARDSPLRTPADLEG